MTEIDGITYLDPLDILIIHVLVVDWKLEENTDHNDLIKSDLLDSALQICRQPYYNSIYLRAAALFRSLIMNHCFQDGNKRTATISFIMFLIINGYDFKATDEELIKFALKVARGYERNLYTIKAWIKRRTIKIKNPYIHQISLLERFIKAVEKYFNQKE